ncbi:family 20 glycosylhydrolase, partial [Yinghuangia sp. YIM S09857]|uniref:family 20 glycosylhydrolase n=1 Tax=Yinghuangia sp. YIM S09857 TaxID=3436929 RepID=UPI003F53E028
MNALIPRPTGAAAPAASAGPAPRGAAWHVTSPRPELDAVVRVVRELLAPHARVAETADGVGTSGAAGKSGESGAVGASDASGASDAANPHGVLTLELSYGEDVPTARPVGVTVGAGDEAHAVVVGADGIVCRGRTPEGVFRAAMSAVQMIATGSVADRDFTDAPRYSWRGVMVDPARSFIGLDELRRLVDLAALYKLNVLHVHLTDNEGWRLEIPGMPELTADGPHYTAEEYRALQEYAAARFVTVIPEIDLPGHCAALRAARPGLPPAPTPPEAAAVLERLGAIANFTAPLDLDDAATADLVRRIFAQVCALTTGPFVHIGADEAAGMTHESYVSAVRHLRDAV